MHVRRVAVAATACLSISMLAGASQAFADASPIDSVPSNSIPMATPMGGHISALHATKHANAFQRSARDAATPDATLFVGCGPSAGAGLQAAVDAAASGDTIVLSPHCVYSIDTPDPASTDSALFIDKTLTINGRNATIERSGSATSDFRVIRVDDPGNLTLVNVTVRGGLATYPTTDGDGGGIELNGSGSALTLFSSKVTDNLAETGGGGIGNYGGTLRSNFSAIVDNASSNGGGGLEQGEGSATFNSSRLMDNLADSSIFGYFAAGGGAVRMVGAGTLTLNSTMVQGNEAVNNLTFGGAIENIYGTVNINSSPIRYNTASGSSARGGAISNLETLNVNSSPLMHNTAYGSDSGGLGGALSESGGPATFRSSPILNNTVSGPNASRGGIYDGFGPVYLIASPVLHNTPDNCAPTGSIPGCSG